MLLFAKFLIFLPTIAFAKWAGPFSDPPVIIETLNQRLGADWVGTAAAAVNASPSCGSYQVKNGDLLGRVDPQSGAMSNREPSAAFWEWYTGCVSGLVRARLSATGADLAQALGPDAAAQLKTLGTNWSQAPWTTLSQATRLKLLEYLTAKLIKESVLADFKTSSRLTVSQRIIPGLTQGLTVSSTILDAVVLASNLILSIDEAHLE